MSRRTSESNKAIAQAWEREKQRVSEGSGTRDWTPDQQRDILRRGKAYDENGKAFEGQHMRSAEMHPECQGDLDNIQFLTREEHLAAHDGDWRNPTNWYYNPVTKEKLDFGDGPIIPCDVIELTDPVNIPIVKETPLCDAEESSPPKEKVETTADTIPPKDIRGQMSENERKAPNVKPSVTPTHSSGFIGFVKRAAKATGSFISAHTIIGSPGTLHPQSVFRVALPREALWKARSILNRESLMGSIAIEDRSPRSTGITSICSPSIRLTAHWRPAKGQEKKIFFDFHKAISFKRLNSGEDISAGIHDIWRWNVFAQNS